MEDVLKVYARGYDGGTVLVCMDGTPEQQTKETRTPIPARPGQPAAYGFGYGRNGTANLFMACAPLDAWRHVEVTDRRRRRDFARLPVDMADVHLPGRRIVPVTASPDTHRLPALHGASGPAEASRLADRLMVHHTPKHGSWLNMAGTGTSVLSRQCLDRWIPDRGTVVREVAAWQRRRNASAKPVDWRSGTQDARIRLKSLYPAIQ